RTRRPDRRARESRRDGGIARRPHPREEAPLRARALWRRASPGGSERPRAVEAPASPTRRLARRDRVGGDGRSRGPSREASRATAWGPGARTMASVLAALARTQRARPARRTRAPSQRRPPRPRCTRAPVRQLNPPAAVRFRQRHVAPGTTDDALG